MYRSNNECNILRNKNKRKKVMDIKSMLVKVAEEQADKMKEQVVGYTQSEEFADKMAQLMNDKINIPFVKEEKEGELFKEFAEVVQDLIAGIFKK